MLVGLCIVQTGPLNFQVSDLTEFFAGGVVCNFSCACDMFGV